MRVPYNRHVLYSDRVCEILSTFSDSGDYPGKLLISFIHHRSFIKQGLFIRGISSLISKTGRFTKCLKGDRPFLYSFTHHLT